MRERIVVKSLCKKCGEEFEPRGKRHTICDFCPGTPSKAKAERRDK